MGHIVVEGPRRATSGALSSVHIPQRRVRRCGMETANFKMEPQHGARVSGDGVPVAVDQWRYQPRIEVVPTAADLPVADAPADALGAYLGGDVVHLVDQPRESAVRTLAHEVAHWGNRQAFTPSARRGFLHAVNQGARRGDPALRMLRDDVQQMYGGRLAPAAVADEVVAEAAGLLVDPVTGRLQLSSRWRSIALFAWGQWARERLYADVPACRDQVMGLLAAQELGMRHGLGVFGLRRGWYRAGMPKPTGPRVPARDLEESKAMLDRSTDWWPNFKAALMLPVLGLAILGGVAGVLYLVGLILGIFRL